MSNKAIWFDLAEQIYSEFSDFRNKGYGDVFLTNTYSPSLSKNPYGDALSSLQDRSRQHKIAWAQYVEDLLKQEWCNLTQKEIWGILYYFVPDFRTELSKKLKQSRGDYDSQKYVFTDDKIAQYCSKYYTCTEYKKFDDSDAKSECEEKKVQCDNKKVDCDKKKWLYDNCTSTCLNEKSVLNCLKKCETEYYNNKECEEEERKCKNEYNNCVEEKKYAKRSINNKSSDVMSDCKDFFTWAYQIGEENKRNLDTVADSQIWAEKYWNGSTEDSPYDIMSDLEILAKLLYRDAQWPIITPTFYKAPVSYKMPDFGNAGKKGDKWNSINPSDISQNDKDWWWEKMWDEGWKENLGGWISLKDKELWWNIWNNGWNVCLKDWLILQSDEWWENIVSPVKWNSDKQVLNWDIDQSVIKALPISNDGNWWYDELVKDLNIVGLEFQNSKVFSNLCVDDEEPVEADESLTPWLSENDNQADVIKFSDLSDEEYQEIVDSMLDAVDKYTTLPSEIEDKIKEGASSRNSGILNSTNPTDLEDTANRIKNCYSSCEWLRIDQKASCMLKCSCWEIESPIFDPNKTPWLWPIFVIRFCGVPATSTSFSVGGKRIYSIEEWMYEIYWALDKLSREGKLGTWTQQNEFLDSSTKKMNIAKSFAFSISIEMVNIGNNMWKKKSEQHEEKQKETENNVWLSNYWIMNDLTNASTKNSYSVIWDWWKVSTVVDEKPSANDREAKENLVADANADRYSTVELLMSEFIGQQASLWEKVKQSISDLDSSAQALYKKKCDNK